jgi:hypothetical protein
MRDYSQGVMMIGSPTSPGSTKIFPFCPVAVVRSKTGIPATTVT